MKIYTQKSEFNVIPTLFVESTQIIIVLDGEMKNKKFRQITLTQHGFILSLNTSWLILERLSPNQFLDLDLA
jgi:hypothetical protein